MNEELNSLPDQELSERFAVEVDRWTCERDDGRDFFGEGARPHLYWIAPGTTLRLASCHPFATDSNAVLLWLDRVSDMAWDAARGPGGFRVSLNLRQYHGFSLGNPRIIDAFAPTFARAGCIAMIRAKRAGA